jgi:hypothetical protein
MAKYMQSSKVTITKRNPNTLNKKGCPSITKGNLLVNTLVSNDYCMT